MDNLFIILPYIPIFFTFYGLVVKSRIFFLLGYTIFAFFIIVSEYLFYYSSNEVKHLLILALFLVQLIVSYPKYLRFDGSVVFKSLILKSCILFSFINIVGVFVVLDNPLINNAGVYYHSFLS